MTTYIIKRLLLIPLMILGITFISFLMVNLAPGTSGAGATDLRSGRITQQQVEVMQETYHIGKPLLLRYIYWLGVIQPEVSKSRRKEWLNAKLSEFRETGKCQAPLTEGFLKRWDLEDKQKLLDRADKDREQILIEWLDGKAAMLEGGGQVPPPLTSEFLREWARGRTDRASRMKLLEQTNQDALVQAMEKELPPAREFNAENVERLMRAVGEPPAKRGVIWGDFGQSAVWRSIPVSQRILEALPVTLILNIICIFIIYSFSIPLGIYSATHHNTKPDRFMTLVLFLLWSLPGFWVSILLIQVDLWLPEAYQLPFRGFLPSGHEDMPTLTLLWATTKQLFLPVVASCYGAFAGLSRYMRVGMIDVLRMDYIRTARAKGCGEGRVIYKHALRNSLIPVITILGGLLPGLLGGSLILEQIFGIPGMGKLSYEAALTRDYTVLMALFTISSVLVLLGILISDILYVLVDPRISFEKGGR